MNIQELSLAEIVTARPQSAALLEKYHLDFCCKGKMKLSEQVHETEILESIVKELEPLFDSEIKNQVAFDNMALASLANHIEQVHHEYVREMIPVIEQHLGKVAYKHGTNFPFMVKVSELFEQVAREMEQHMMKEEKVLFPAIRKLETHHTEKNMMNPMISIDMPVAMMEAEHESAGELMNQIRTFTNNFTPPDGCCTTFRVSIEELKMFEEDLHMHVYLENHILFPKAIMLQKELMVSRN